MKKITIVLLIILIGAASIFAQAPQAFKYQAVVRDSSGNVIGSQLVSIRVSIIQNGINGTLVYSETHSSTTNLFGMIALEIGNGTIETGIFDDISWGTTSHFLELELDETGGTNYQFMGTSQLLSVPYALNSGSLTLTDENGNNYIVSVDTLGNLHTTLIEWNCGNFFIDDRDGQKYNTVQIGSQCWMKENLNIGTMINGSQNQQNNSTIEKYCYDNDTVNCDTYGGLYQWKEMMQYKTTPGTQGICPLDWHLPTDEEWKQLEGEVDYLYGYPNPEWDSTDWRGFDAGLNLKSTNGWNLGGNGTDLFGFTAIPSGYRDTPGNFAALGNNTYFWSGNWDSGSGNDAWHRILSNEKDKVSRNSSSFTHGFSTRCLKD